MKKYITLAALLAAGTAMANAGTGIVELEGVTANSPIVATSILDLDDLKTIALSTNTNRALLGIRVPETEEKVYNWSISVGSWSGTDQLHIYTKSAGESIFGNATASFTYTIEGVSNPTSSFDIKTYFDLENKTAVKGAITLGYAGTNATQVADGTAVVFSVLYEDGEIRSLYGINTGYKYSSLTPSAITYDTDLLNVPVVTTTTDWTKDTLIATNIAAVPEPSAFGLLAGIGALALVASRRRRRA